MGKPAARISDMHTCPMVTPGLPPIPHVGGPIVGPGCPTVLIGGMPAAVMGDMCTCVGPPDTIVLGSAGVMIGGKPAARMGDQCAHGGTIVIGCPTVLIGEVSPGTPPVVAGVVAVGISPKDTLSKETKEALKMSPAFATKVSRIEALKQGAEEGAEDVHKHNEEDCKVQYHIFSKEDKPVKGQKYEIHTSDGQVFQGTTDSNGKTQSISGYTEGMCEILFLD